MVIHVTSRILNVRPFLPTTSEPVLYTLQYHKIQIKHIKLEELFSLIQFHFYDNNFLLYLSFHCLAYRSVARKHIVTSPVSMQSQTNVIGFPLTLIKFSHTCISIGWTLSPSIKTHLNTHCIYHFQTWARAFIQHSVAIAHFQQNTTYTSFQSTSKLCLLMEPCNLTCDQFENRTRSGSVRLQEIHNYKLVIIINQLSVFLTSLGLQLDHFLFGF